MPEQEVAESGPHPPGAARQAAGAVGVAECGYTSIMMSLRRHLVRTKRAAVIGVLVAMPLVPLAGCGGDDSGDVPSEVDNNETGGPDGEDDGAY